jgi:ElaB/YqjD/DUF883 family membrane-anchored ribosome-binding protein
MTHLEDDDLVLHYYGEGEGPCVLHLEACAECRARLESLQDELGRVPDEAPEPAADYEARLWEAIRPRLGAIRPRLGLIRPRLAVVSPVNAPWGPGRSWRRIAIAASFAASLVLAFLLGRQARPPAEDVRERILLVAVGDHLERSEVLLLDLLNADDPEAPAEAEELLAENRLYRQAALRAGDGGVASLLDELERVLVEAAAAPDGGNGLEELRRRIESRGLVLKIRRVGSRLRDEGRARPGQGEES